MIDIADDRANDWIERGLGRERNTGLVVMTDSYLTVICAGRRTDRLRA